MHSMQFNSQSVLFRSALTVFSIQRRQKAKQKIFHSGYHVLEEEKNLLHT